MSELSLERAYLDAVYEVDLPTGTVRFRIGDTLACPPFALVTAHNPARERPANAANEVANAELAREIETRGLSYVTGRGMSTDGAHVEPSFALFGIPRDGALELARAFGQAAIVWFDGEAAVLVWTGEHTEASGT